jgi:hypothetical protein
VEHLVSENYHSYQPILGVKGLVDNARKQLKVYKDSDFSPLNDITNPNANEGLRILKKNLINHKENISLISQVGQQYAVLYQHEKKLNKVSALLDNQVNGNVSNPYTPKVIQNHCNQISDRNYFIAEVTMPDKSKLSEKETTYKIVPLNSTKSA